MAKIIFSKVNQISRFGQDRILWYQQKGLVTPKTSSLAQGDETQSSMYRHLWIAKMPQKYFFLKTNPHAKYERLCIYHLK
jgi:hypothetical protein